MFNGMESVKAYQGYKSNDVLSSQSETRDSALVVGKQQYAADARQTPTLPKTPLRATPNSSRKRLHTPNLFRDAASPSHHTKMHNLFHNAASNLHNSMASLRSPSSNEKTPRSAVSQNRLTRFGGAKWDSTGFALRDELTKIADSDPLSGNFEGYQGVDYPTTYKTPSRSNAMASQKRIFNSLDKPPSPNNLPLVSNGAPLQEGTKLWCTPQGREPMSSGFAFPSHSRIAHPETPSPVDRNARHSRVSNPPHLADQSESDDEEHSTHGVRLVLPYTYSQAEAAQQANIDAWIEEVLRDGVEDTDSGDLLCQNLNGTDPLRKGEVLEGALQGFSSESEVETTSDYPQSSRHSSNKENVPPPLPSRIPPPPYKTSSPMTSSIHSPSERPSTSVRKFSHPLTPGGHLFSSTPQFSHPMTPGGHLSAPPRRKKLRAAPNSGVLIPVQPSTPQDNTIRDDDLAVALATLSPSVERHRKGHGPKRVRCASFWDTDVLEPGSPAYPTQRLPAIGGQDVKVLRNGKQVFAEPE